MNSPGTIVWHVYDLDLNRALRQIKTEVERKNFEFKKNPTLSGEDYFENMKMFVDVYCNLRDLDSDDLLRAHSPILTKYDDLGYESHLGFCLLAFDVYKIPFFLEYQKGKYAGKNKFVNLVEFIVYDYVRENSAFKLEDRLSKIAEWISDEKKKEVLQQKSPIAKEEVPQTEAARTETKTELINDSITYDEVIDFIWRSGITMEKNDTLYNNKNENGLRDALIAPLQTRLNSYTVTSESQRKSGRTDILLKHINGTSEIIGECKIWKRVGLVHEEVTQLLKTYLTVRDRRAVLVYFVTKNEFTTIFKKLCLQVSTHDNCIKKIKDRKEFRVSYKFNLPDDKKVEIELELMAFHFPPRTIAKSRRKSSKKKS